MPISKICACFCCLGEGNDDSDFSFSSFFSSCPQEHETGVGLFSRIQNDGLNYLTNTPGDLERPLLIERPLTQFNEKMIRKIPLVAAAAKGDIELIETLSKDVRKSNCDFDEAVIDHACIAAARHRHLEAIKFFFTKIFPKNLFFVDLQTVNCCSIFASARGHIHVLKFLFKKSHSQNLFSSWIRIFLTTA